MKRSEIFPSKYVKAEDLDTPRVVTIATQTVETFKNNGKEDQKLMLTFHEKGARALVVNRTNFDAIADLYGGDTDDWLNKKIELYADQTRMQGKLVDCVRVRAPGVGTTAAPATKAPAAKPESEPEFEDEIPF
jgi:hypothetical protein